MEHSDASFNDPFKDIWGFDDSGPSWQPDADGYEAPPFTADVLHDDDLDGEVALQGQFVPIEPYDAEGFPPRARMYHQPTPAYIRVNGKPVRVLKTDAAIDQGRYQELFQTERERGNMPEIREFLATHQSREGVDFDAVNEFCGWLGLDNVNAAAAYVVSADSAADLAALLGGKEMGAYNGEKDYNPSLLGGMHMHVPNVTFTVRQPIRELHNGGAHFTEGHVFHEIFHKTGGGTYVLASNPVTREERLVATRAGQGVMRFADRGLLWMVGYEYGNGQALEESVAVYYERMYSQWRSGSPNGGSGGDEPLGSMVLLRKGYGASTEPLTLPFRFTENNFNKPGVGRLSSARSLGGAAVEMMVRMEPRLFDAFIQARASVAGKRTVARLMNGIKQGLYDTVRNAGNTGRTFDKADGMQQMYVDVLRIAQEKGYGDTLWDYDFNKLAQLRGTTG